MAAGEVRHKLQRRTQRPQYFAAIHHRRIRRVLRAVYPVGRPVVAEGDDEGLRMTTAVETFAWPWTRIGRVRPGPVVIRARDTVTRRRLAIPRQLFPDAWLDHVGAAAHDA